jgi:hypothetical protein
MQLFGDRSNGHLGLYLDYVRDFRGRRYRRAGQTPGHAREKARGRIAASMLDIGQQTPILVRADGARFVLVEGLHRLEAQDAWRENHHRLRRGRAQALNGPPVVLAGDAAVVT